LTAPASLLTSRFLAGTPIAELAEEYGLSVADTEDAVRVTVAQRAARVRELLTGFVQRFDAVMEEIDNG